MLQGPKNGLEIRYAYRISKWLQLVFGVQGLLIVAFYMVVINVCFYNKIYYVWFVDINQCHSVLREHNYNVIELNHIHINELAILYNTYCEGYLI